MTFFCNAFEGWLASIFFVFGPLQSIDLLILVKSNLLLINE